MGDKSLLKSGFPMPKFKIKLTYFAFNWPKLMGVTSRYWTTDRQRKKRHELNWYHSKDLLMAIQKNIGFVYLGDLRFLKIAIVYFSK